MDRRKFLLSTFNNILENAGKCIAEINKVKEEISDTIEDVIFDKNDIEVDNIMDTFFESYEKSYSLTLAYPREVFEKAAEQVGIDHTLYTTKDLVEKLYKEGVL